jgi:hypothetical protein
VRIENQTAILAKIKGFDEFCDWVWNPDTQESERLMYYEGSPYEEPGFTKNSDIEEGYSFTHVVPTQSELQTWLRNVHGIHISIEVSYDDLKQFKGYENLVYRNSDEKWASLMEYIKDDYSLFTTYEDALEDGLVKALMMLPNLNN